MTPTSEEHKRQLHRARAREYAARKRAADREDRLMMMDDEAPDDVTRTKEWLTIPQVIARIKELPRRPSLI